MHNAHGSWKLNKINSIPSPFFSMVWCLSICSWLKLCVTTEGIEGIIRAYLFRCWRKFCWLLCLQPLLFLGCSCHGITHSWWTWYTAIRRGSGAAKPDLHLLRLWLDQWDARQICNTTADDSHPRWISRRWRSESSKEGGFRARSWLSSHLGSVWEVRLRAVWAGNTQGSHDWPMTQDTRIALSLMGELFQYQLLSNTTGLHQSLKLLSPIGHRCSCWLNAIADIDGITRPQTAPINNKRGSVADLAGPNPRVTFVIKTARRLYYFSDEQRRLREIAVRTLRELTKRSPRQQWRGFYWD